jgi:hypothetical protein
MKIAFLPETQDQRNRLVLAKLKPLAATSWLVLVFPIALAIALQLRGPVTLVGPQFIDDSGNVLGPATALLPDLAVLGGEGPEIAHFVVGALQIAARRLGLDSSLGNTFSLYELERSLEENIAVPVMPEQDDRVFSDSGGLRWEGRVVSTTPTSIEVQPEISVPAGSAVYRIDDGTALVGFAGSGISVIPARQILTLFPQLTRSR